MRRRKLQPRLPPEDGVWLRNRKLGVYHFMSFDELQKTTQWVMDPCNSVFVEQRLGKMHYTKDPTYDLVKREKI